ncbi:hypothetical protein BH09MYX1_BH09MYX1_15810 [soil metagenome]
MTEPATWVSAVGEGKVREVLGALPPWPNEESRPVLALLARLGEAPRIDAVVHGILASDALAFATAIEELVALGAPKTAALYVERRPDEEGRAAGKRALDAKPSVPLRDMYKLPTDALRAFAENGRGIEALSVKRLLAARAVAAGERSRAAEILLHEAVGGSVADLAIRCRIDGALATWATGDRATALVLVRALGEVLGADDVHVLEGKLATPEPFTWKLARELEGKPLGRGAHDDGRGVIAALGHEDAVSNDTVPELADLESILRRKLGYATIRAELDPSTAALAIDEGALVIVEEERSMRTGIRIVLGVAPGDDLYLVRDPDREEAAIVPAHWQASRSWLFASSALIVCGTGEAGSKKKALLLARGVEESTRLRAMDQTGLDDDGEKRTAEARIARLRALAKTATSPPIVHGRLGEALLDAVRRDQVKKDELTAWYADVRERFPAMEMPSQTYAAYLEQYGSAAESGIAWAAAFHRDRFDARNAIGWGRALKRMGKLEDAFQRFRDASRLDPADPYVYGWFSTCHFGRNEHALAELRARISAELLPTYRSARTLLADALEAMGNTGEVEPVLRDAWELGRMPEDGVRLVRAGYRSGDVAGAKKLASEVAKRAGGESWGDAIIVHVTDGDDEGASDLARTLVRGQRPQGWPLFFVDGAVTLAKDDATAATRIEEASLAVMRDPVALCDLAIELAARGQWTLAAPVLALLRKTAPDNPNTPWTFVRSALRSRRIESELDEIRAECKRLTTELAPGFVPLRAVAAAVELPVDPKNALEIASHASFTDDPKSWLVSAIALRAIGETARADALVERLSALAPGTLSLVSDFYRFYELWDVSREALAIARGAWNDEKFFSLEHVALAIHDRKEGALADAREACTKWDWVPVSWLCAAAIRAKDAPALAEMGARGEKVITASSASGGDPWVYRGFVAAASSSAEGREELLEKLPRHPWLRAAFVLAGDAFSTKTAEEDRKALMLQCPVSHGAVIRRWEGP